MSPAEAAQFVASHRDTIDRVIAIFARYYALSADETARLADSLDATLAADDYRVIRSNRGACAPASFFAVVLASLVPRVRRPTFGDDGPRAHSAMRRHASFARARIVAEAGPLPPRDSEWRVHAAGVVVGVVRLRDLSGLVAVPLVPSTAYPLIAAAAQQLGARLRGSSYWAPWRGDLAAALAAQWSGPILGLTSLLGESVPVASLVVVDTATRSNAAHPLSAVIDFRLAAAVVPARITHPAPAPPNTARRPAA